MPSFQSTFKGSTDRARARARAGTRVVCGAVKWHGIW